MTNDKKENLKKKLENQQYNMTGDHSAVKICTWTKKSLTGEGFCYKQKFYGIRSHLCCQISPSVGYCQNACIFCWREIDLTLGTDMENIEKLDEPEVLFEKSLIGQRKLLSGFGGHPRIDKEKLKESDEPMHFAISLTGEPLLYPKLNELIKLLHDKGKSTFVVTNGQLPEVLETLELPTQIYISVDAPNKEFFQKIECSANKDGWERLNRSLDIFKKIKDKTRTSLRLTIIKGINDSDVEGWSKIIDRSSPKFVEVKAYMFVGSSRLRLSMENMPRHHEVKEFAQKICDISGYRIIDEKEESRVILLMKEDFDGRIMEF